MLKDFPFLVSLAASESLGDRRIWLRIVTDHFVAAGSSDPGAIEEFVAAMKRQLHAADPVTRLEIAGKLAPCAGTPSALLAALESIDSEARDYLLEHAVAYGNRELGRAVARGGRCAIAVAKRRRLDLQIVEALAAQEDIDVLIALAGNSSARLEGQTLVDLVRRARRLAREEDPRLADALLNRRPMRPEGAALFLLARPSERIEILLAAQRLQLGRPAAASIGVQSALLDRLEQAAIARQSEQFVNLLAGALDCEQDLAQKIFDDPSGEPLAVALAALGAGNEVLVRVLISKDLLAGTSYQRIRALARLNNALNRNAAMAVIAALKDDSVTPRRRNVANEARAIPASSRAPSARRIAKEPDLQQRALGN